MPTVVPNRSCDPAGGTLFYQENRAASPACPANFRGSASMPGCHRNQLVDQRCSDAGCVCAPQLPFFAQESGYILPTTASQGLMHGTSDLGNSFEVAEDVPIPVDMRFEYFPIVDPRFSGSTRVGKHEPGFDLFRHHRNSFTVDAVGIKMDCAHPAIQSRIIILATCGHCN